MNRREILLGGAALALAPSWARAQAAKAAQDRRHERHVGRLRRLSGHRLGDRRQARGRRLFGHARRSRRDRLGRSPEQARRRRGDRPQVVRFGWRRRHHGSAQFGGRAGGGRDRDREEQGGDRFGRRHFGADRPQMLARFRAVDLRHLRARPRARPCGDRAGRQDLVLHHRRLRFRQGPAGQLRRGGGGGGRQDAGRGAPSAQHGRLFQLPAAGAGLRRGCRRVRQRGRRPQQLAETGPRIRPRAEAATRELRPQHHQHARARTRGGRRLDDLHAVLLGLQRRHARLRQALPGGPSEQVDAQRHAGGHVRGDRASDEGDGSGEKRRRRDQAGRRDEGDPDRRSAVRQGQHPRRRPRAASGLSDGDQIARRVRRANGTVSRPSRRSAPKTPGAPSTRAAAPS